MKLLKTILLKNTKHLQVCKQHETKKAGVNKIQKTHVKTRDFPMAFCKVRLLSVILFHKIL